MQNHRKIKLKGLLCQGRDYVDGHTCGVRAYGLKPSTQYLVATASGSHEDVPYCLLLLLPGTAHAHGATKIKCATLAKRAQT